MMRKSAHIVYSLNKIGGRANLEDAISPAHHQVFIVCDGVGGSSAGEIASATAVNSFYPFFRERASEIQSLPDFVRMIDEAAALFVRNIRDYISKNTGAKNTSTTLTLAVIKDDKAYIAWCGDSRIYHVRDGKILYRTKDHSLVQELLTKGVISEQEAANHPQKNVIVRSLASNTRGSDIETAVIEGLVPGDWLLLCTDGLLEQFNESKIGETLKQPDSRIDYAARIDALCTGQTKDNYSMYLVNYSGSQAKNSRPLMWYAVAAIALVLVVILVFKMFSGSSAEPPPPATPDVQQQAPVAPDTGRSAFKKAPLPPKPEPAAVDTNKNAARRDSPRVTKPAKPVNKPVIPEPDGPGRESGNDSLNRK